MTKPETRPWWVTRWVPAFLFKVPYLGVRIDAVAVIRDRSSGEKITALKIYFGHTAIAGTLAGVTVAGTGSLLLGGLAGVLWWIAAEILDTIQFGWSPDSLFDGMEYGMAFIPVLVAHFVAPVTRTVDTFLGPMTASLWPVVAFLTVFGVWFHLLPVRARYG